MTPERPDIGGRRIDLDAEAGIPEGAEPRVHDARADLPDRELDSSLRPPTLADFEERFDEICRTELEVFQAEVIPEPGAKMSTQVP